LDRLQGFFRNYTEGMSRRDVGRLFNRDAAQAYAVLTRGHEDGPEPKKGLKRIFYRVRLAFLGLSYKLSPARRFLFAASCIAFLVGMLGKTDFETSAQGVRVSVDFSPLLIGAAFGGLVYLLALELVDRVRVRDELEVARELQSNLLPGELPLVPGYLSAHSYRTANEVGGDYYDLMPLPDGRIALVVSDASGHGMAAGLVMAIANATLKTALDLDPAPERVIALLNRTLCRTGNRRTFMSAFFALLDPRTGEIEYVCAGHPYPYLLRADGSFEELGTGGLPLGLKEPLAVETGRTVLRPGDLLLLYTDGLVEAVNPLGTEAFGYERLRALLEQGGTPASAHRRILESFDLHVGQEPLRDDLTMLILSRVAPLPSFPAPPARSTCAEV
jgi:serine phosphatase RsbU (regulator of sigma subunit)